MGLFSGAGRLLGRMQAGLENQYASIVEETPLAEEDDSIPMAEVAKTSRIVGGLFVGGAVVVVVVGAALGLGCAPVSVALGFGIVAVLAFEGANVADGFAEQASLNTIDKVTALYNKEEYSQADRAKLEKALERTWFLRHVVTFRKT